MKHEQYEAVGESLQKMLIEEVSRILRKASTEELQTILRFIKPLDK